MGLRCHDFTYLRICDDAEDLCRHRYWVCMYCTTNNCPPAVLKCDAGKMRVAWCCAVRRPCSTSLSHAPSLTPQLGSRNRQGKERDHQGKSGTYGEERRSTPTAIKEPTSGTYWESKPSKALCTFSILFSLTLTRPRIDRETAFLISRSLLCLIQSGGPVEGIIQATSQRSLASLSLEHMDLRSSPYGAPSGKRMHTSTHLENPIPAKYNIRSIFGPSCSPPRNNAVK